MKRNGEFKMKVYERMRLIAQTMNATPTSSGIVDGAAEQMAARCRVEICKYISGELANIVLGNPDDLSAAVIEAVAVQLAANSEFVERVERRDARIAAETAAKAKRESAKRAAKREIANRVNKAKADSEALCNSLNIGDRVSHQILGEGTVTAMDAATVTVLFGGVEKKLMKQFSKLSKI